MNNLVNNLLNTTIYVTIVASKIKLREFNAE
jgi:hypothetical protein